MNHPPSTVEMQTVFDKLSSYAKGWLVATLDECNGHELTRLVALTRVADMHALRLSRHIDMPDVDPCRSFRICRGADVLVPELLARLSPTVKIERRDTPPKLARWASTKLEQAGALSIARREAFSEEFGLSECEVKSGSVITIGPGPAEIVEVQEDRDRNAVNDWDRTQTSWHEAQARVRQQFSMPGPSYKELLSGRLRIYPNEYEPLRSLRNFFEANVREYVESESFPDHVQLGPLTFGEWKKIAIGIAAHITFRANYGSQAMGLYALKEKDWLNLLGPFLEEQDARNLVKLCIPTVDTSSLDQVLEVFSSDANDIARLRDMFIPPSPMLVKVPGAFLTSYYASWGNPYFFMAEKLKTLFKDQWRNAAADANLRETPFREQLYAVLCGPNYAAGKNLKVKRPDGTEATDIDAVLYERMTNIIYLVQLKWPDVLVGEWKRRRNDSTRLRSEGLKWINEVTIWREREWAASRTAVLTSLQLEKIVTSPETVQFKLLVVSRSWTRFTGQEAYDDRAAWTSWTRLRKLIIQHRGSKSPLEDAWPELREPRAPRPFTPRTSTTHFDDLILHFKVPA